jgi:hypothetical protein
MKKCSVLITAFVFFCIILACGNEESDFEKAKETNTVQAIEEFIEKHPESRFIQRADEMLDSLRYYIVKSKASVADCKEFLENYPESRYVPQVEKEMKRLGRLVKVISIPAGLDVYSCKTADFVYVVGSRLLTNQDGEFVEAGYCGKAGMLPLFKSANRIGKTPCSIEFDPGEYMVGVMMPLARQLVNERASGVLSLATDNAETVLLKPNMGKHEFFLGDNHIFSFFDLRQKVRIHPFSQQMIAEQREDTVFYGRIYQAAKGEGVPVTVVSLFQQRGDTYDTIMQEYPAEAGFIFDESELTSILSEKGIVEEEMPKIFQLLERGGKAIVFGKEDSTVVEITDKQKYMITQIQ